MIIYSVLFQSFLFAIPPANGFPRASHLSSTDTSTLQGLADRVSGFFGADFDAVDLTATAFGPKKFTRTQGAPNNYVETFTLPTACAGGTHKIVVKNGEENGTNRISSAEIKLNSVPLLVESDFNQNTYEYEKPVALVAENTLEIQTRAASLLMRRSALPEPTYFALQLQTGSWKPPTNLSSM